ncbi:unnamed protein product [Acanthoscelides obtectus]|nr:unnamed protein product [Acanthoscelides obtectus]CAK1623823.1 Insulin [Acanthoscelides obtectus]
MISKIVIFFAILYTVSVCASPYMHHTRLTKRVKYCGPALADIVNLVCSGKYYAREDKRFSQNLNFDDYKDDDISSNLDDQPSYPFIPKELTSLVPMKIRRGIVEECCHNACSQEQIKEYCMK